MLPKSSSSDIKITIEDTITVKVNGVEQSTGWYYDLATNSIVFDQNNIPQANSFVYISYNPISDCEG